MHRTVYDRLYRTKGVAHRSVLVENNRKRYGIYAGLGVHSFHQKKGRFPHEKEIGLAAGSTAALSLPAPRSGPGRLGPGPRSTARCLRKRGNAPAADATAPAAGGARP